MWYIFCLNPSPLPFSLSYPDFCLSVFVHGNFHSDYSSSKVVITHISFLSPLKTLSQLDFAGWGNHPGEVELWRCPVRFDFHISNIMGAHRYHYILEQ